MTDYIDIPWPEVRKGDFLFHENGDRLTVQETSPWGASAGGLWRASESWEQAGFFLRRKVEPVPTVPGAYHDEDGLLCILTPDYPNDPYPWIAFERDRGKEWHSPEYMAARGPFTRLVPMPTEEQVYAVLEKSYMSTDGTLSNYSAAVMSLLGGESGE